MHRDELFQTNQTKLKSDGIEGGEALILVNCGQMTDATRWNKLTLGLKAG